MQSVFRRLYPPQCLSCRALVDADHALCGTCWRDTPFLVGLVCDACGTPLPGDEDAPGILCDGCMSNPRPWSRGRAAMLYHGTARRLILALKHGDRTDLARPFGQWLHRAAEPILAPDMLVTPVPLHWSRLFTRRFNQSALISRALAIDAGLAHCPDLLQRIRRTAPLDGVGRDQRFAALADSIRVNPRRQAQIDGRHILLVDDVMTSGATLTAATQAALDGGAHEVSVVTLARVAKDA